MALDRGVVRKGLISGNLDNKAMLLALNVLNEAGVSFRRFALDVYLDDAGWFPNALSGPSPGTPEA
jgi:hypothetical protein